MNNPVRLVCRDCGKVYRIKHLIIGKTYSCKNCEGVLRILEPVRLLCPACGATTSEEGFDAAFPPHCHACEAAPPLVLEAERERAAEVSEVSETPLEYTNTASSASPEPTRENHAPASSGSARGTSGGSDLSRLPRLIQDLSERLEEVKALGVIGQDGELATTSRALRTDADSIEASLKILNDRLPGDFRELDAKISGLLEKLDDGALSGLSEQLRETGSLFLAKLDEYRSVQQSELAGLLASGGVSPSGGAPALELNVEDLAERVVAGVKSHSRRMDGDGLSAVDALARVAEELVREQSGNSSRLDNLAEEIRTNISGLREWKGDLPARVADEIGRTVEERVVGPISGALARQAPAILSELQDNKLVDIVSRSVREAQRPLLREILAGGRTGVPVWLFASVLIPLLLVLGYLFLPGELGFGDNAAKVNWIADDMTQVADGVARFEASGIPLTVDAQETLRGIDDVVRDIHRSAEAHVSKAAGLEEEVKNLHRELEGRDKLINDYKEELQRQVNYRDAYKARLNQLGVQTDKIVP